MLSGVRERGGGTPPARGAPARPWHAGRQQQQHAAPVVFLLPASRFRTTTFSLSQHHRLASTTPAHLILIINFIINMPPRANNDVQGAGATPPAPPKLKPIELAFNVCARCSKHFDSNDWRE